MSEDIWERVFREHSWGRWPAEEIVRAVARTGRTGLRVLEVGCGAAAQLWYLAHEGHRPIGLDVVPAALAQATARLADAGVAAPLLQADARALPLAPECFDMVIDVECVAHLDGPGAEQAWGEAARVLVPGGRLVSIGFTARTAGAQTGERRGPHTVHDATRGPLCGLGTVSFLDEERVGALAGAAGLRVDDLQVRTRTVGPAHDLIEEMIVVAIR